MLISILLCYSTFANFYENIKYIIYRFNVLLELSQNQSLPRISSSQAMTLLVLFKTQLMKEKVVQSLFEIFTYLFIKINLI